MNIINPHYIWSIEWDSLMSSSNNILWRQQIYSNTDEGPDDSCFSFRIYLSLLFSDDQ